MENFEITNYKSEILLEALAEQVRHLDKEGAAVAAKARLDLAGEGIKPVAAEIVVVTYIECRPRIWRPAKKKLAFYIRGDGVKVDSSARKNKTAELISRAQRNNVFVKGDAFGVVADQSLFGITQRRAQGRHWFVIHLRIEVNEVAGSRIEWRLTYRRRIRHVA